jgi:hypothetical protein
MEATGHIKHSPAPDQQVVTEDNTDMVTSVFTDQYMYTGWTGVRSINLRLPSRVRSPNCVCNAKMTVAPGLNGNTKNESNFQGSVVYFTSMKFWWICAKLTFDGSAPNYVNNKQTNEPEQRINKLKRNKTADWETPWWSTLKYRFSGIDARDDPTVLFVLSDSFHAARIIFNCSQVTQVLDRVKSLIVKCKTSLHLARVADRPTDENIPACDREYK